MELVQKNYENQEPIFNELNNSSEVSSNAIYLKIAEKFAMF